MRLRNRFALAFILVLAFLPITGCFGDDIGSGGVITSEPTESAKRNCNYDDNLDLTADEFISKCCKGSIRRKFPSDYYGRTLREIQGDNSRDGKSARKLLKREEYRK